MRTSRGLLIGSQEVPARGGGVIEDHSPYTGEVLGEVAAAGPADVTAAVDAADAAFPDWSRTKPHERRDALLSAADRLAARKAELVALMAAETGGTAEWATFNVSMAAEILRHAATVTASAIGEVLPSDLDGCLSLSVRQPVGVVASITPWNAPLILCARAIAMPLALGNTVVVKPSESAPFTAGLVIADVLREAGLDHGEVNVVTNAPADAAEVTRTLIADPRVRRVNFTGSTAVGRTIARLAADHLKPVLLELGGKNSLIVLGEADLDYAVSAVAFGAYLNSGQICMSADRILVHERLHDEFVARLADRAGSLVCGDPSDPATQIGPLIDARSARRVADLVRKSTAEGAVLHGGTPRPEGPAESLLRPMVLSEVSGAAPIYREETFGPVASVLTFSDTEQAISIANDSPYGLTAGVLSENLSEALAVARRLRTGIVHVNDQTVGDEPQAPFGGVGDSGYGRFGGRAGVDEFTDLRWITVQDGHRRFPL
ncbi:aldehyde dehydrogenase family protein [Amycolatopsis sp. NPDC004368]